MSRSDSTPTGEETGPTAHDLYLRGKELLESDQNQLAEDCFRKALELEPESAEAHNALGVVLFSRGDLDRALFQFNQAIQFAPKYAKAYSNRGTVFGRYHFFDAAKAEFEFAMKLDPDFMQAKGGYGLLLASMGKCEHAIELLEPYLSWRSDDLEARTVYARCLFELRDHENALTWINEILQEHPEYDGALNVRAHIQLELGDLDAALCDLNKAIELAPHRPANWSLRSNIQLRSDEFVQALNDIERAILLSPDEGDYYYTRAYIHHSLGKKDQVLPDLDRTLHYAPDHQGALKWRLKFLEASGEEEKADEMFERIQSLANQQQDVPMNQNKRLVQSLLQNHFAPLSLDDLTIVERTFPMRMQADLQLSLNRIIEAQAELIHFCGVYQEHSYHGLKLTEMVIRSTNRPVYSVPPEYQEVEIGEESTIKCVNSGLWLLKQDDIPCVLLLDRGGEARHNPILRIQFGTPNTPDGTRISNEFFRTLEKAITESTCYRGKLLSLEQENRYSGKSSGIKVHQLRDVERNQVILPQSTLDLLDRNVLQFIERRPQLAARGLSTQKGVLFYGPPGTGKTHTIHYLVKRLKGHTTFIISAEQVGMLAEYMTLARLLQPSVVVLEDVDLIARDRDTMNHGCDEVLLNKLLNEMDGLTQQTDVLFILTTNRPESLEAALASRPGRIDQAIEFPYPDEVGREKLIRLYACGSELSDEVIAETVRKTEQVSAAFIKELMRRAFQFQLERNGEDTIRIEDIDAALEELIFSGGSLNQVLLGAQHRTDPT